MASGGRDVGCVVTVEDEQWGFGMTDYGRATAAIIEDFLAPITKAVTHPRRGCQHRHLRRIGLGPHDRERNQLHRLRGHRLTQ